MLNSERKSCTAKKKHKNSPTLFQTVPLRRASKYQHPYDLYNQRRAELHVRHRQIEIRDEFKFKISINTKQSDRHVYEPIARGRTTLPYPRPPLTNFATPPSLNRKPKFAITSRSTSARDKNYSPASTSRTNASIIIIYRRSRIYLSPNRPCCLQTLQKARSPCG